MAQQNLENGSSFGVQRGKINANFNELYSTKIEAPQVLVRGNTTVFTPTLAYDPATKLYADQLRTNWDNTFNPQNILADVFDRPNHTGVQEANTITQDVNNRFVADTQIVEWNSKEPAIGTKNTAFNKNFGTGSGTVATGDHTHTTYEPVISIKGTAFNKDFGTTGGTVAEGNHTHVVTAADVGLGNVDNTSDVNKPVSTVQQTALDLKQDTTTLAADVGALAKAGNTPFANFMPTKTVSGNYTVNPATDYGLIVEAITSDAIITLPLLSSLVGKPYQIIEIFPVVANGYKVRILTQGSDTYPYGNTWFDMPFHQAQFGIGLHESGFGLRRNVTVWTGVHRDTTWDASNFTTPTGIPWEHLHKATQTEIITTDIGGTYPERVTVHTTGEYTISWGASIDSTGVASWTIVAQIYVNGVAQEHLVMYSGNNGGKDESLFATLPVDLVAGDYVEFKVSQDSLTGNIVVAQMAISIRL